MNTRLHESYDVGLDLGQADEEDIVEDTVTIQMEKICVIPMIGPLLGFRRRPDSSRFALLDAGCSVGADQFKHVFLLRDDEFLPIFSFCHLGLSAYDWIEEG